MFEVGRGSSAHSTTTLSLVVLMMFKKTGLGNATMNMLALYYIDKYGVARVVSVLNSGAIGPGFKS